MVSPGTASGEGRRSAAKARHRSAILDAAEALVAEAGAGFSVDQLAERAAVSRRSIFNHFSSLDDVVIAVCTRTFSAVLDNFETAPSARPRVGSARSAMFDEIARTLRATDFPSVISHVAHLLGGVDGPSPRQQLFANEAFARVAEELTAEVTRRHRDVDPLDCELLVRPLMTGLRVISSHWLRTERSDPEAARREWGALLERLITTTCSGY